MNASTSSIPPTADPEAQPCGVVSITPQTFLDFPGKIATVFWFARCNLRCPYCYNPHFVQLAEDTQYYTLEKLRAFLNERRGFLDAVVMSGGECTLSPTLPQLCRLAKSLGLAVKIDTNGGRPEMIRALLDENLIDFVSLDIKTHGDAWSQFSDDQDFEEKVKVTLRHLLNSKISFEARTTFHPDIIDESTITQITQLLHAEGYKETFYIQSFYNGGETLGDIDPAPRKIRAEPIESPLPLEFRNP